MKSAISSTLRPGAGNGIWLALLVPCAYWANYFKHFYVLEFQYKLSAFLAIGLVIQSAVMLLLPKNYPIPFQFLLKLVPALTTSILIWLSLHQSITFSLAYSIATSLAYEWIFYRIPKSLPKSFTLGEASIVAQGFVLLMINAFVTLVDYSHHIPTSDMQKMSAIVQITLVGVTVIVVVVHTLRFLQGFLFYPFGVAVVGLVMAFPIAEHSALGTLLLFVVKDWERIFATCIAVGLVGATSSGVAWFVVKQKSSSTRVRKYFHVLIVLVFVPGLIYQCTLLFVASGMLLAVFVLLETARLIELWPLSDVLHRAVGTFLDSQDSGLVALTPIYLLAGCALPMWLHPCPCDLTDSAGFGLGPLLAGVLSVGIGDAAASVFGSMFGKHKWHNGSNKSIEGTIFGVVAQLLVLPPLVAFGVLNVTPIKMVTFVGATVVNGLVEAKTDQIDNLVLPLVTYIILTLGC